MGRKIKGIKVGGRVCIRPCRLAALYACSRVDKHLHRNPYCTPITAQIASLLHPYCTPIGMQPYRACNPTGGPVCIRPCRLAALYACSRVGIHP